MLTHKIHSEIQADIRIRVSNRAKYACLKVSPAGVVEVVVPKGFQDVKIAGFIDQHRDWLTETLARMKAVRNPMLDTLRPDSIELLALGETWTVNYAVNSRAKITEHGQLTDNPQLWVWGANNDNTPALLRNWLVKKAKVSLHHWLDEVCTETGLQYAKLSIRGQKTRWGSCSHKKHINLNRALLFLPPELVRYLLVHELCHTVHLNHSRAYWSLVARWEPNYRKCEKLLNYYSTQIPLWAYA